VPARPDDSVPPQLMETTAHAVSAAGGIDSGHQVVIGGAGGFDEQDLGARRDGVRPLDVERGFHAPAASTASETVPACLTTVSVGIAQAHGEVEFMQIGNDGRCVVRVDDGDRLSRAVADSAR